MSLGLCALPSGRKIWFAHRWVRNGVVKRTLSAADVGKVEETRRVARALIAQAACGELRS